MLVSTGQRVFPMQRLASIAQPTALRLHAAARRIAATCSARSLRHQPAPQAALPCCSSIHSHHTLRHHPFLAAAFSTSQPTAGSSAHSSANAIPLPPVPFFAHFDSPAFLQRTAITLGGANEQAHGVQQENFTYAELLRSARRIAGALQRQINSSDLRGRTVCLLHSHGFHYSSSLLGVWLLGGIAVPLHPAHAKPELEYLVADARAEVVLVGRDHGELANSLTLPSGSRLLHTEAIESAVDVQPVRSYGTKEEFAQRQAMLIYTSGTTAKPKGVEWTHLMLETQMRTLCTAWGWSSSDHILHVLPLHHVHGVVNVLLCALYAGARVTWIKEKQGAEEIVGELLNEKNTLTVFMAVPTIYARILTALGKMTSEEQQRFKHQAEKLRLMVSGSAALPSSVLQAWEAATGHLLLERYGMSECGMILSQSLDTEKRRRLQQGTVGEPMQGVEIRIVPKQTEKDSGEEEDKWHHDAPSASNSSNSSSGTTTTGELLVRGPSVFKSYWHAPEKTASEFTPDGWFKTGDIVSRSSSTGQIRILGRSSVDILKSGGYKISAIDVERELLKMDGIAEVAVVGVPSQEYGQIVSALVSLHPSSSTAQQLTPEAILAFAKKRLAKYQVPRQIRIVQEGLPKNAMGKVNKKQLVKLFDVEQK